MGWKPLSSWQRVSLQSHNYAWGILYPVEWTLQTDAGWKENLSSHLLSPLPDVKYTLSVPPKNLPVSPFVSYVFNASIYALWNFTPEILSPYWFFKVLSLPQDTALWSSYLFEVGLLRLKMGSKNKNSLRCAHFAGLFFVSLAQSRVIWDGSVLIEEPCPSVDLQATL